MRVQWFAYLIFTVLLTSCKARYEESLVQLKIADNWEFKNASEPRWHKADVPGDIISEASKIKGFGERSFLNLRQLNEILNTSWEYRNIFNVSKDLLSKDSINISFPDIRGSARIYMNDSLLSGHMMNEGGSLSCKQYLKAGKNELRVVFGSVGVSYLSGKTDRAKDERISSLMKDLDHLPFRNIPAVPGLIETPFLTGWSDAKIEDVYFYPLAISGKMAQYNAEINIIASKELEVNLEICVDAKSVIKLNELKLKQGLNKQIVSFTIANPKLWWANGFGQQHLYNVTFRLISSSHLAHEVGYPLGACKFEVLYDPDSIGKSLIFMLNGNPVFLKGGTLDIPRNLNPSEVQALYQQIVDNAKAANINTIRLLNFNFTRDDLFYKLCSENGILVWQDFTVFKDKGKHNMDRFNYSIEQSVKYLRNLPCCAVYMGKNEDCCKDYKSKQIVRTTGVVEKKLPITIKKYDHRTFYWPFCENKEERMRLNINTQSLGLCDEEGFIPSSYTAFSSFIRFAGNLGFSASETRSKMQSQRHMDTVLLNNSVLALHIQQVSKSYPQPVNLASAFYLSQLYQADKLKEYIENFRLKSENYIGFTDPGIYDANPGSLGKIIDFTGRTKPAYFTLRDSYAANILIAQTNGPFVNVYAVNDDLKDLEAILLCKMIDFFGNTYFVKQVPVRIKANSKALLLTLSENELLSTLSANKVALLLQLNQPGHTSAQNIFYFAEPKLLELPKTNIKVDINQSNRGFNVILKSNVFVKNLWLETNRPDTRFSDNNIDILPGKRYKISVFYNGSYDELAKNLLINSLNNLR